MSGSCKVIANCPPWHSCSCTDWYRSSDARAQGGEGQCAKTPKNCAKPTPPKGGTEGTCSASTLPHMGKCHMGCKTGTGGAYMNGKYFSGYIGTGTDFTYAATKSFPRVCGLYIL
jgi:hypothetical protein